MSKRKAMFVTTIIMVLLTAVILFIYLNGKGFGVVEGLFAVYGYIRFTSDLCRWLRLPDAEILRGKHGW